jgi:hypothetical protein
VNSGGSTSSGKLEACNRDDGLEELRAKQRAWLSREAEMLGIPDGDEEPPCRPQNSE